MKHIKVNSVTEAWEQANRLFPTDYMKNDELSQRAGYPTYFSTAEGHEDDHINDLGCRLELCIGNENIMIWIKDDRQRAMEELAALTKKLYPN